MKPMLYILALLPLKSGFIFARKIFAQIVLLNYTGDEPQLSDFGTSTVVSDLVSAVSDFFLSLISEPTVLIRKIPGQSKVYLL